MRIRATAVGVVLGIIATAATAHGQYNPDCPQVVATRDLNVWNEMLVGGATGMGFTAARGDGRDNSASRFSGGGRIYLSPRWVDTVAIELGVGLVDKGYALGLHCDGLCAGWRETKVLYLEIPVGLTFQRYGVRLGVLGSLNTALWERTSEMGGAPHDRAESDRTGHRRFNLGLKLTAGYAFEQDRVTVVPGLSWSTHLLDEIEEEDSDARDRLDFSYATLMVDVAVEFTWFVF